MSRDAAAEPAVYISTLKALLDAASGAAEERAQGIAEAVVQELMVDTCSVALRRRGEAEARLVGHARRWDAGAPALDETQALALARLAGGEDDRLYFVRRNGVFVPGRAAELAGEACVVLPVDAGKGASATLVVYAQDAIEGFYVTAGARAQRALAHRSLFPETLTWFEIHGGDPDTVETWKTVMAQGPVAGEDLPVEGHEPGPRRRRRRRRRRGPIRPVQS